MKKPIPGRKPSTDKKIPVQVYTPASVVNAKGGIEKARSMCLELLEQGLPSDVVKLLTELKGQELFAHFSKKAKQLLTKYQ